MTYKPQKKSRTQFSGVTGFFNLAFFQKSYIITLPA